LLCRELLHDSSFSVLFFNLGSFRPRSLINPAAAGQVERPSFGARKIDGFEEITTAFCRRRSEVRAGLALHWH
jgi:hypothetical protein